MELMTLIFLIYLVMCLTIGLLFVIGVWVIYKLLKTEKEKR